MLGATNADRCMKRTREANTTNLLHLYDNGGEGFLLQIVKGDETWVHYFEPKTKQQLMERHHMTSPRKKKFKSVSSAGKIMVTVFGMRKVLFLCNFLPRGTKVNSNHYTETLRNTEESECSHL